jgi:hypothetical protein
MNKSSKLITTFLSFQQQVRLYHWSTKQYARHVASDELYKKLDTLIDRFIETLQGKQGRLSYRKITLSLHPLKETSINKVLKTFLKFLTKELDVSNDDDLTAIRDDMVELVNKTLYLFSLR